MEPLAAGLDALYASPLGEDAIYRPLAGGAQIVRVLRRMESSGRDWAPTGAARDQLVIAVRSTDVDAPVDGDEIDLGGRTYRVRNARRHPRIGEWALEVEEVVA